MPRPRFTYLLGLGIVLIGLAFAVTDWAMGPKPGVTEANCRRIQEGMTKAEVEAILGGPGQWCTKGGGLVGGVSWQSSVVTWKGPHGTAFVTFGSIGYDVPQVVEVVDFQRAAGPSPLERLRAWLGL